MKKVGNWFAASWSEVLLFVLISAVVVFLLGFALGDLVPGLSQNEVAQATASNTVESIVNNPLGLPHKALQFAAQRAGTSAAAIRAASVVFGLAAIGCFYYILSNWYTKRIALIGTLIFATSAWFLHTARLGTDTSMYLLLFCAVACAVWLQNSKGSMAAILASAAVVIMLLYIPGMVWFVVPVLLWQIGRIGQILEEQNTGMLTLLGLTGLTLLAPIGWAMYQHPDLIKTYFGLPQAFPAPVEILKNLATVPVELFFRGPNQPEIWLARLPLLNLFVSVMFVAGTHAYVTARKLDRTWLLVYVFGVGSVLMSLGGSVDRALILPFVYLVATSGIALLLQQWFAVFPKNPFARSIGSTLMTVVVLLATFNSFNQYFIAWPNAPETKQVFTEKLQQSPEL